VEISLLFHPNSLILKDIAFGHEHIPDSLESIFEDSKKGFSNEEIYLQ
jgi:hypothetical protein